MTTMMRRTLKRTALTLIAVTLGMSLFATGVWAGSARRTSDQPATVQARGSFWNHDLRNRKPDWPGGAARLLELRPGHRRQDRRLLTRSRAAGPRDDSGAHKGERRRLARASSARPPRGACLWAGGRRRLRGMD